MKILKGERVEINKYKQNGITLIALVVTIVVLLILAGTSIGMLTGEDGIIEKAQEAAFKKEIKDYQETAYLYITSKTALEDGSNEYIVNSRNTETNPNSKFEEQFRTDLNNSEFEKVFKKLKSGYTDKICIYNNEFYYIPISEEKKIQREIKWCFEVGVKVWGYESYDEYNNDVNVQKGEYIEKNGIYVCEPDLTQFNKELTHYVTYDESGNEIISESIKTTTEPEDWYDYNNNEWANIVTISGDKKAYWVWIPRYVYILDQEAQTQKLVKIKFVDTQDYYIDFETKQKTQYPDREPQFDENGYQTNYCLPEAFTWDRGGETERELPGYWVSKYEIAEANKDKGQFYFTSENNAIEIKEVKIYDASASAATKYDIYINNVLKAQDVTIPYTITGLATDTEYRIKAVAKSGGKKIGMIQEEYVKTAQADISTIISPDLTGFNTATTYYVTYDDSGNETRTPITSSAPSNWYDYNNNKWANIVTSNNGKEAYFVWIPRYEYKVKDRFSQIQIRFITKDVTTPSTDYKIPDAFTWDGNPISGYWVSKYEMSEAE